MTTEAGGWWGGCTHHGTAPAGCWNLYIVHADRIINICLYFIQKYLDYSINNQSCDVKCTIGIKKEDVLVPVVSFTRQNLSKLRKQTKTIILAAEVYVDFLQDFSDKLRSQTSRGRT